MEPGCINDGDPKRGTAACKYVGKNDHVRRQHSRPGCAPMYRCNYCKHTWAPQPPAPKPVEVPRRSPLRLGISCSFTVAP